MRPLELGLGKLIPIQTPPGVPDVGRHNGDKQRDNAHNREGELAARAIVDGERTLEIGSGGVVRRAMVASQ